MKADLELFIDKSPFSNSVKIWLQGQTERQNINYTLSDGMITETVVDISGPPTVELKPFIEMPTRFASQFIELLINESNRTGLYTKQQNILEGKLAEKDAQITFLQAQLEKYINKSTR